MNLVNVRWSLYGNTDQLKEIFSRMNILDFNAVPTPIEELKDEQKRCCALVDCDEPKEFISDQYFNNEGFFIEGEDSNKSFGSSPFQLVNENDLGQMVGNSINQTYSTLFEVIDEDNNARFLGVVPKIGLLPLGDFDMERTDMKTALDKVLCDFIEYSSIQSVN